jgi:hypothetical protein
MNVMGATRPAQATWMDEETFRGMRGIRQRLVENADMVPAIWATPRRLQ